MKVRRQMYQSALCWSDTTPWQKQLVEERVYFLKRPSPSRREVRAGTETEAVEDRFTGFLSCWKDWNLLIAQPQRLPISSVPIIHWRPGRFLELLLLSMLESQISWFNINQQRADELTRDSESKQKSKSPSRSFYLEKEKYDSDLGWIFFWIIQSKIPQRSVQQLVFWLVPVAIKLITEADHYRMILQTGGTSSHQTDNVEVSRVGVKGGGRREYGCTTELYLKMVTII